MDTIPLFPLSTVLLPYGRIALQIFEPRYLDLVSRCLKSDSELGAGFGVVWLREGQEVYDPENESTRLAQIGTLAKIVDWDSLANGLLGITIEGERKFRLYSSRQQADHLHVADVEWIEAERAIALPEYGEEMKILLRQLTEHPHVQRLGISADVNDISTLGCLLTQLLPIPENIKFKMLIETDPMDRLQYLIKLLDEMSQ